MTIVYSKKGTHGYVSGRNTEDKFCDKKTCKLQTTHITELYGKRASALITRPDASAMRFPLPLGGSDGNLIQNKKHMKHKTEEETLDIRSQNLKA
jgi:single-stranded DNA-binding protein